MATHDRASDLQRPQTGLGTPLGPRTTPPPKPPEASRLCPPDVIALRAADDSWRCKSAIHSRTKKLDRRLEKKGGRLAAAVVAQVFAEPWVETSIGDMADERLRVDALHLHDASYNMAGRVVDRQARLHVAKDGRGRSTVFDGNGKPVVCIDYLSGDAPITGLDLALRVGGKKLPTELDHAVEEMIDRELSLMRATSRLESLKLTWGLMNPAAFVDQANLRRARLEPRIGAIREAAREGAELRFWEGYVEQLTERVSALADDLGDAVRGHTDVSAMATKWSEGCLPMLANLHTAAAMAGPKREPAEVLQSLTSKLCGLPGYYRGFVPSHADQALLAESRSERVFSWQRGDAPMVRDRDGLGSAQSADWGRRSVELTEDEVVIRQTRADQVRSIRQQIAALPEPTLRAIGAPRLDEMEAALTRYEVVFDTAARHRPALAAAAAKAQLHLALHRLYAAANIQAFSLDPQALNAEALALRAGGMDTSAVVAQVLMPASAAHLEFVACTEPLHANIEADPELIGHLDVLDEVDTALAHDKARLRKALVGSLVLADFLETIAIHPELAGRVSLAGHSAQMAAFAADVQMAVDSHAALVTPTFLSMRARAESLTVQLMDLHKAPKSRARTEQMRALVAELRQPQAYFTSVEAAFTAVPRLKEAMADDVIGFNKSLGAFVAQLPRNVRR